MNMSISERIQSLRKQSGDSQEQLADKLDVSRQAISKWESGQGSPDLNNIIKISEVYSVSTDYILKGSIPVSDTDVKQKSLTPGIKRALSIFAIAIGLTILAVFFLGSLLVIIFKLNGKL